MNQPSGKRRSAIRIAVLTAVAAVALVVSVAAGAATPTTVHVGPVQSGITLDAGTLCDFPIDFSATFEYTATTFFENDGVTVAMRITQGIEQDTFSANGKTLLGDEYHFTFQALFENGVRVARYAEGVAERVPLPGGGVLIVAGHVLVDPGAPIVISVDSGNSGNNVAAFCAALS